MVILFTGKNWIEINNSIQMHFPKIINWLRDNKLTLNIDKTKFVPFSIYINGLPEFEIIELVYKY